MKAINDESELCDFSPVSIFLTYSSLTEGYFLLIFTGFGESVSLLSEIGSFLVKRFSMKFSSRFIICLILTLSSSLFTSGDEFFSSGWYSNVWRRFSF